MPIGWASLHSRAAYYQILGPDLIDWLTIWPPSQTGLSFLRIVSVVKYCHKNLYNSILSQEICLSHNPEFFETVFWALTFYTEFYMAKYVVGGIQDQLEENFFMQGEIPLRFVQMGP